jgi:hypothetical protein
MMRFGIISAVFILFALGLTANCDSAKKPHVTKKSGATVTAAASSTEARKQKTQKGKGIQRIAVDRSFKWHDVNWHYIF